MRFEDKTFSGDTITPEGNDYVNCTFQKCSIVFTATTGAFTFKDCKFLECRFGLGGAARTTVMLLKGLHKNFGPLGREFVKGTIQEIMGEGAKG